MNESSAIGTSWDEFKREIFTPEEIAESKLRVSIMAEIIKARQEKGITRKKLKKLSGVKKSTINKMEKCSASPCLDDVLKVLAALGKTFEIVPINKR